MSLFMDIDLHVYFSLFVLFLCLATWNYVCLSASVVIACVVPTFCCDETDYICFNQNQVENVCITNPCWMGWDVRTLRWYDVGLHGTQHGPAVLEPHTSIRTGHQYMLELLNQHPDRMFNKICIYRLCFDMLIQVLRQQTGLQNSKYLTLEEHVMIFVYVISQQATNRMAMEDWQHFGSTISVVFTRICKVIASLSQTFIKPPNFDAIPDEIRWNPKYYPYF